MAQAHEGGAVDLSLGTPYDPPPAAVVAALSTSNAERGYPSSIGNSRFREAASGWLARRFDLDLPANAIAACVGAKEFIASAPKFLKLKHPERDTVLYPAVSYPTYSTGASLAGCRAVAVPMKADWTLDLEAIDEEDAARALMLWVNSPGNPTGALEDLSAVAKWGQDHNVAVFSDECYAEFTWEGGPRTILSAGVDGVVAVHSLSKRSNLAGLRAGFYTGDPDIVGYLGQVRLHAGLMMPGPVQEAAAIALDNGAHVIEQRTRYLERLEYFSGVLEDIGLEATLPGGTFFLWVRAGEGSDATWELIERLASEAGILVDPGELYGHAGEGYIRVAMVQPMDRLKLAASRFQKSIGEYNSG